jgi:hypothetical protein
VSGVRKETHPGLRRASVFTLGCENPRSNGYPQPFPAVRSHDDETISANQHIRPTPLPDAEDVAFMVSFGGALILAMSVSCGAVLAGSAGEIDTIRQLGILGLGLGCLAMVVAIKIEAKRENLDRLRNPKVWANDASYVPQWAIWTIRIMGLTLVLETQLTMNNIAGL